MLSVTILAFLACSSSQETPTADVSKADTKTEAPAKPAVNPKAEQLQKQASAILGVLPDKMPGSENDTPEKDSPGQKVVLRKGTLYQ